MFPEEMIDDDGALLRLELRCTGCGHKRRDSFRWACVDPAVTSQDGWDGANGRLHRGAGAVKCASL